jgi:hypothetical protein
MSHIYLVQAIIDDRSVTKCGLTEFLNPNDLESYYARRTPHKIKVLYHSEKISHYQKTFVKKEIQQIHKGTVCVENMDSMWDQRSAAKILDKLLTLHVRADSREAVRAARDRRKQACIQDSINQTMRNSMQDKLTFDQILEDLIDTGSDLEDFVVDDLSEDGEYQPSESEDSSNDDENTNESSEESDDPAPKVQSGSRSGVKRTRRSNDCHSHSRKSKRQRR